MRRYGSQCKPKIYQACEVEGSECGITEINANGTVTKLAKWKAASAVLQKSVKAEDVQSMRTGKQQVRRYRSQCMMKRYQTCELEGSECGVTEVNAR